jgi:hydrogenase nickel incorporation protein HypA/HybF
MHERGAAKAALKLALGEVADGERVIGLELSLGELCGHGAEALALYFRDLCRGTAAEDATLEVRRRTARLRCLDCGLVTPLSFPVEPCPACGGVRSAEDLREVRVEAVELLNPATGQRRRVVLHRKALGPGSRAASGS